jgi:hypothetical protein
MDQSERFGLCPKSLPMLDRRRVAVRGDVASWPEGEVPTCVGNVCSLGNCGRDVLAPSLEAASQINMLMK